MTKRKEVPQATTEIRMVDGAERVFVVRELPPSAGTKRTTIANVKGEGQVFKRIYSR
jgi:hypothetical protein